MVGQRKACEYKRSSDESFITRSIFMLEKSLTPQNVRCAILGRLKQVSSRFELFGKSYGRAKKACDYKRSSDESFITRSIFMLEKSLTPQNVRCAILGRLKQVSSRFELFGKSYGRAKKACDYKRSSDESFITRSIFMLEKSLTPQNVRRAILGRLKQVSSRFELFGKSYGRAKKACDYKRSSDESFITRSIFMLEKSLTPQNVRRAILGRLKQVSSRFELFGKSYGRAKKSM